MAGSRMRRINEVLREVVGATISSDLSDPRIGFVTVTSVETTPDLRTAKVFVSVLGDDEERDETLSGAALLARGAAEQNRRRDADEADPDPELPLRRHDRAGRADLPAPGGRRGASAE